ncbi:hypothetical protein CIL05_07120 [Virgibacillus profundi]|uniref:Uncharacterized protein n=1 Tax=Virgibacillus profundi TaxID=2024555 RepID=A0A2A2IE01_9BACI|nr:hypothetical protein [Virgibacillus profundi]PAV30231.1 hypothetical protein CIL05_07120 [Virgibacillus profundi]PXY54403.1 hypothetical protein CIT14_07205 [Virgibacillus profundi]
MNRFEYETDNGWVVGYFDIYQARNGFIYLVMGNNFTKLTLGQIEQLNINCYSLKDYDHDDFVKAYNLPF